VSGLPSGLPISLTWISPLQKYEIREARGSIALGTDAI
jgi:hypothetical protein